MRRVLRHVFTLISALSLVLCLATAALWVRSASWVDQYEFEYHKRPYNLSSTQGHVGIIRLGRQFRVSEAEYRAVPTPDKGGVTWLRGVREDRKKTTRFVGIFYGAEASHLGKGSWWAGVHFGVIVLMFAVAPLLWTLARIRWRRRITTGICANCGYDLRASPERCPECGMARVA